MPLQVICPGCTQTILLPYTEAGMVARCPNCQHPIALTAADAGPQKKEQRQPRGKKKQEDYWFLKAENGNDYGPVTKRQLDEWFAEGRISPECQVLHVGDEQWRWASDLFPELEIGQGTIAQGAPVNRYDISDLLPPVIAPTRPAIVYGLPVSVPGTAMPGAAAPAAFSGGSPAGESIREPLMVRRLSEAIDPNVASSELYQETVERLRHQRYGQHPFVVAIAVVNFLFGTYVTILAAYSFVFSLIRALDSDVWWEGGYELWLPLVPLAAIGYGLLVLRTALGLLNYELWTIMSTYILSTISLTVSFVILVVPAWIVFPPILILVIGGFAYGILSTIVVTIPSIARDFD